MLYYGSSKVIPAAFASFQKQFVTSDDGTKIGVVFNITINGKIVAYKGSPHGGTLSGTGWGGPDNRFWTTSGYPPDEVITQDERLRNILRKQESLRKLFATDGLSLEVQPWDGSQPVKCNPRVKSISFQEGLWVEVCDYTIELEADVLYINGVAVGENSFTAEDGTVVYLNSVSEEWSLEFAEDRTDVFRLTHSVGATGKRFYDDTGTLVKQGWEQAKAWVVPKLGIDATKIASTDVMNLTGYSGYSHSRAETTNELTGSYSVTETWIVAQANAIEDFTVETKTSIADGKTLVTVNGTVRGLEQRDSDFAITVTKYTNAAALFTTVQGLIITRAQSYSGITLNAIPADKIISRNETQGVITYNYSFDNRPANFLPNALTERFTVVDHNPSDSFASITILGRPFGPLLQSISTNTGHQRTISVEATFPPTGAPTLAGCLALKPDTNVLLSGLVPPGLYYKSEDTESWNWSGATYSRQLGYTYEV